jgi:hypothetical protein
MATLRKFELTSYVYSKPVRDLYLSSLFTSSQIENNFQ